MRWMENVEVERKISLTGVVTATMAFVTMLTGFAAMIGGWYTFSNRIGNTEVAVVELKQENEADKLERAKLNDTLNRVNSTLGAVEQALEDNHIHVRDGIAPDRP